MKTAKLFPLTVFFHFLSFTVRSQDQAFNSYLLKAVDVIENKWALLGYDKKGVFTHDLSFGQKTLKASYPPGTMCVAAQMEIIVTALNIYVEETRDSGVFTYLPAKHWISTQSKTFKDLVWVNSGSQGTAYALKAYGMGKICSYKELIPGSFVNINRNNHSGHAVLFISYIDKDGNELKKYSDKVKGFKYFSSQGKGIGNGGFGYRYAFFGNDCPVVEAGKKRDCGLIYSEKQSLLNCGYMLLPKYWDKKQRDAMIAEANKIHGLSENRVNAKYEIQNTTDD